MSGVSLLGPSFDMNSTLPCARRGSGQSRDARMEIVSSTLFASLRRFAASVDIFRIMTHPHLCVTLNAWARKLRSILQPAPVFARESLISILLCKSDERGGARIGQRG